MSMAPSAHQMMLDQARWRWSESLFWLSSLAVLFVFPSKALLFSQIAIMGLFALSLDLILGYGGIVSLGHAAFFRGGGLCGGTDGQAWHG